MTTEISRLLKESAVEMSTIIDESMVTSALMFHDSRDETCKADTTTTIDAGMPHEITVNLAENVYCACRLDGKALWETPEILLHGYLKPMGNTIAAAIDRLVAGLAYKELAKSEQVLRLPRPVVATAKECFETCEDWLDGHQAPDTDRHFIYTPSTELECLKAGIGVTFSKFNTWLTQAYDVEVDFAWQKSALLLVTRPQIVRGGSSIFLPTPHGVGIQYTLEQTDTDEYLLGVKALIGVHVDRPSLAIVMEN
jgi:hypothetical protein